MTTWVTKPTRWPGHSLALDSVQGAIRQLGVTPYQLGLLLGSSYRATVYGWLSATHRPSSLFAIRLLKLLELHNDEVPVSRIRRIDWRTGEVWWRTTGEKTMIELPGLH
jgi:hypothetical protein